MRAIIFLVLLAVTSAARAQNVIHAYAVGDWRDGPVVTISPLFATTEAFSTLQLIAQVKQDYPEYANITDIDVQRFATADEGELSRTTLKAKYEVRKLQVKMLEAKPADPIAAPVPEKQE